MSTPDLTKFVGVCLLCQWQVQTSPRARSELGGTAALYQALVWAAHEHLQTHSAEALEHLRQQLPPSMSTGQAPTGGVILEPLPRWWVEK